ncbi:mannose-1-phosphate guanylyltransferase [Pancytospora epiphaga]|nr:mannose-1-phosphate guanylyltransferase [Pancytospora epiphaga]
MKKKVTKAIILVGGWGTRLRPLTYTTPKPLVPFCNRPMLEYQIEKLMNAGVKEVILAVNYYSEIIIGQCREYEKKFNVKIIYSKEDVPLGTGGPLALAEKYLRGCSFFVMNSDICCNADVNAMVAKYMSNDSLATIMTYPVVDPTKYGLIKTKGERITSFIEKPKSKCEEQGPWIINAGMYIFSDEVLDYIQLREMSLETEVFPVLAAEEKLGHFSHDGYWMDIGQIMDYLEGQRMFLESLPKELFMGSSSGSEDSSGGFDTPYSSPSISSEINVVIGKNVQIGKNVVLRNCTIFDNVVIGDNSTIINSVIGWECVIGSGCYVDGASALGKGVHVENGLSINSLRIKPMESVYVDNLKEFQMNA